MTAVGCSVGDPRARVLLRRAAELEGADLSELPSPLRNCSHGSLNNCCALVFDLAPWDDSAIATLSWVRSIKPIMPVLLYTPTTSGVARLLLQCGRIDGVRALSQSQSVQEPAALRTEIRALRDGIGGLAFLEIVKLAFPKTPGPVLGFVRVAVRTIRERHDVAALTVESVSSKSGMSARTLHRSWRYTPLPSPKEMLDWLVLLFVSHNAECSGLPLSTAAGHIRMDRQRLYRIRRRLLGEVPKTETSNAAQEFDFALLGFLERCGVPRSEAVEVRRRIGA